MIGITAVVNAVKMINGLKERSIMADAALKEFLVRDKYYIFEYNFMHRKNTDILRKTRCSRREDVAVVLMRQRSFKKRKPQRITEDFSESDRLLNISKFTPIRNSVSLQFNI